MPVDTQQIMDAADKLGQMVAQHPAIGVESVPDDRLMWRADPRGTHSEAAWRRRLPAALRFMYRRG